MLIWAFKPFETQRSYRARKSAVAVAGVSTVAAGNVGLAPDMLQTT
jgi:hypothetical protein